MMIGKLKLTGRDIYENTALAKINELADAVNELQIKVNKLAPNIDFAQPEVKENVRDKFAKQRQWIGCVCRFWYDNPDDTTLDYLGKIQIGENGIEYYGNETYDWFPHCEPVKPTDSIIYKGGNNE